MKELLNIGNAVDDGTGDYLRKGGDKINNNFDEIYSELGDGSTPFSAGAWKAWKSSNGSSLEIKFGQSYTVDTTGASITVVMPKGTPSDYNKPVRIRDVYASWEKNPLTIKPASGDTLKGNAGSVIFNKNYQDLELVYCPPGRWEYLENKFVDKITANTSTVAKKSFIATQGQTDFLDVFDGNNFNSAALNVYRRGNLLWYSVSDKDGEFNTDSDYGSPGEEAGSIIALDGKNIRMKVPCNEGDTIVVETFLEGVSNWQASYNRVSMVMKDSKFTDLTSLAGERWVGDLSTKKSITLSDMGIVTGTYINPYSVEVLLNGRQLVESGDASLPLSYCDGAFGYSSAECEANGGTWVESDSDFAVARTDDQVSSIDFSQQFEDNDILVIRWFNNNIGTTMNIDEITAVTDERYLNVQEPLNLKNRIEYTNYENPGVKDVRPVVDEYNTQVTNLRAAFDIFHPIGSVYENMHNPANPGDYMGMGTWILISQGKVLVGWNNDATDPNFAYNNNDLDSSGQPSHTAGGTVGATKVQLSKNNVPALTSENKVLIADDNGTIIVGGCQFDPDAEGPGYTKYREGTLTVNADITSPVEIPVIQPSITVYRWLRVA